MHTFIFWFLIVALLLLGFVIWLVMFIGKPRLEHPKKIDVTPSMTADDFTRYESSLHRLKGPKNFHASRSDMTKNFNINHERKFIDSTFSQDYIECQRFITLKDWDMARQTLQRIAYSMPGQPQEIKNEFTAFMRDFAAQDPLVYGVLRIAMPLLRQQPGMLQTQMYKHLPGIGLEESRYALYFAEQLGILRREKKGNSYKLYPAEYVEN